MTTGQIGILVSDYREPQTANIVLGLEQEANALGYSTVIFSMLQLSERFSNNEECVFDLIDYSRFSGIVIVTQSFSPHREILKTLEQNLLQSCPVPVFSIGDSDCFPVCPETTEDIQAEKVTSHLIDVHGCRTIYFLGGEKTDTNMIYRGQCSALTKHDIPINDDWFLFGGYWIGCAEKLAKEIAFGEAEKPDAVVCVSDIVASALIKHLYRYGMRVPEDVIVTGLGRVSTQTLPLFTVTSAEVDYNYIGKCTIAALYHSMTGKKAPVLTPKRGSIVTGMSCGCGLSKPLDLRMQLELIDKHEEEDMQFRNSNIEERLYSAPDLSSLTLTIKDLSYLVPDKQNLSVNLLDESRKHAECIFLSGSVTAENSIRFPADYIYPAGYPIRTVLNTQVFPLMFNRKCLGFMTIGYQEAAVPCQQTLNFAVKISNSLMILDIRTRESEPSSAPVPSKPADRQPVADAKKRPASVPSLFVTKDGITSKLVLDSVLYFDSTNKKVYAITGTGEFETNHRLYEIEAMLIGRNFLRISKSTIVNLNKVLSYRPDTDRTLILNLTGHITVRVSRSFVNDFKNSFRSI